MSLVAERAARQEERADELAKAVAKALGALTTNATRNLGDIRRDASPTLATDHTASVEYAADNVDLSDTAVGKYTASDVHETLKLEMSPSDLVASTEPPKYEKLRGVLATLDELLEEQGIFGEYRDLIERKKAELVELEDKFRDSQVDIDSMDHAGFHSSVETLKRVVLTSVESIVEKLNIETDELVDRYQGIVRKQLDAYDQEAAVVEATSPARMRGSRPEDDEDPWQAPPESLEITYASSVLQAYVDAEKQARVTDVYEQEWTQERRRDIDRLVARAQRVVSETDADQSEAAAEVLSRLADVSAAKVARVEAVMRDSDGEAREILGALRASLTAVQEAGAEFQRAKQRQREASERDLERIRAYLESEAVHDGNCRAAHAEKQQRNVEWLHENDQLIAGKVAQLLKLQEEVVELARARQAVSDEVVESAAAEQRRRAKHAEMTKMCGEYRGTLEVSMRNFLLPEGYSSILADFAAKCETLAQTRFDHHGETLDTLLRAAADEASRTRSTAFVEPRLRVFRYKKRVDDVLDKAALARAMRDFCQSTLDPYLPKHESTEAELLALAARVEACIPALQQQSERHRDAYDALAGVLARCGTHRGFDTLDDLLLSVLDEDELYVVRAPRPPLVTLVMPEGRVEAPTSPMMRCGSRSPQAAAAADPPAESLAAETDRDPTPHLVVPPSYYAGYLVERAAKAQSAVKHFA